MCIDMCMDMCIDVRIDVCIPMCIDMCIAMCTNMCIRMYRDRSGTSWPASNVCTTHGVLGTSAMTPSSEITKVCGFAY